MTGTCAKHQRQLSTAVSVPASSPLLPYVSNKPAVPAAGAVGAVRTSARPTSEAGALVSVGRWRS